MYTRFAGATVADTDQLGDVIPWLCHFRARLRSIQLQEADLELRIAQGFLVAKLLTSQGLRIERARQAEGAVVVIGERASELLV